MLIKIIKVVGKTIIHIERYLYPLFVTFEVIFLIWIEDGVMDSSSVLESYVLSSFYLNDFILEMFYDF